MIAECYESWRSIRKKARGKLSHEQAKHFMKLKSPMS